MKLCGDHVFETRDMVNIRRINDSIEKKSEEDKNAEYETLNSDEISGSTNFGEEMDDSNIEVGALLGSESKHIVRRKMISMKDNIVIEYI